MLNLQETVSELKSAKLKIESQLNQSERNLTNKLNENEELKSIVTQVCLLFFKMCNYNLYV